MSSLFKVKVIVYHVTDDHHLGSIVINHRYTKTIQLIRGKNNHYDVVYSEDFMNRAGACQNVLMNVKFPSKF